MRTFYIILTLILLVLANVFSRFAFLMADLFTNLYPNSDNLYVTYGFLAVLSFICGILPPIIIGFYINKYKKWVENKKYWKIVFLTSIIFYTLLALIVAIFRATWVG